MAATDYLLWHDAALLRAIGGTVEQRMGRAVLVVRDQVRILSNRGNPTGKDPSLPGEPPKKVSGTFVSRVTTRVVRAGNEVIGIVGTNVPYQPRLELGFVGTDRLGRVYHQAPRPAFRPALELSRVTLGKILGVAG